MIGRDDELEELLAVIEDRNENLVLLTGEEGIGRKAILQELTYRDDMPTDFADGVGISPVLASDEPVQDLRQAIWREFYAADGEPNTPVAPHQRLKDLNDINALLIIPDIDPYIAELPDLLHEIPRSLICASVMPDGADELRDVGQSFDELPIGGLTEEEMLELFGERYRSDVPAAALDDVLTLCTDHCEGNPARIEVLASEAGRQARPPRRPVPDEPHPLIEWAARRRQAHERPVGASEDD